jgi:hypothetical protein
MCPTTPENEAGKAESVEEETIFGRTFYKKPTHLPHFLYAQFS